MLEQAPAVQDAASVNQQVVDLQERRNTALEGENARLQEELDETRRLLLAITEERDTLRALVPVSRFFFGRSSGRWSLTLRAVGYKRGRITDGCQGRDGRAIGG